MQGCTQSRGCQSYLQMPSGEKGLASWISPLVLLLWLLLCCCCGQAGPAPPDGCLSAAEEMLWKVWVPASAAVVPSWATTFSAWSLFFNQLHTTPEGPTLPGFLSRPQAAAFLPKTGLSWGCTAYSRKTKPFIFLSWCFLLWCPDRHSLPASLAQWHPGPSQISLALDFGGTEAAVSICSSLKMLGFLRTLIHSLPRAFREGGQPFPGENIKAGFIFA